MKKTTYMWTVKVDNEFILRDGMNVELYHTKKSAREYLKIIKHIFPISSVVNVRVEVTEVKPYSGEVGK